MASQEYMLLDMIRLSSDCKYYLSYGNRHKECLWAKDEKKQIEKMKSIYKKLKVKPKWLSYSDIVKLQKRMIKK